MIALLILLACKDHHDDTAAAPSLSFLSPEDGAQVVAGDVQLSLLVEGFALEDPAKHNEGEPEGFLRLAVNGTDTLDTAQTTPTLTLAAGATILDAELLYSDGDSLEPAVTASLSLDVVAP